jgi:hypothetical protein
MMNYIEEVKLLRSCGMTHVDVDHYVERGIRHSSGEMTIDQYEAWQVFLDTPIGSGDSYVEIINVMDVGNCEFYNAKEWFADVKNEELAFDELVASRLAETAIASVETHL